MNAGVSQVDPVVHGVAGEAAERRGRNIRLLVFTSLYPNRVQPRHGIFVEERLRHLVSDGRITATVIAPVPWFPFTSRLFGAYSAYAQVPAYERRYGIDVHHPRYPVIPKFGMTLASSLMFRAVMPFVRKFASSAPRFDLIDAHYLYPDGVVAVRLGSSLNVPTIITARGSDVTLLPRHHRVREKIVWAARHAAACLTVSRALGDGLVDLGVDAGKITELCNGVDLDRFGPRDRDAIRARLGLTGFVWLTVGGLVRAKGVHIAVEALSRIPLATLLIAGEGPERRHLAALAVRLGVDGRVRFLGALRHDDLADYYNAADVLIHASSREGMPNVVLESLACGTPVVAAPFDSAAEVIAAPAAGRIAASRTAEAVLAAWKELQLHYPGREATRRFAERFGWGATVSRQQALYAFVLDATSHAHGGVRS